MLNLKKKKRSQRLLLRGHLLRKKHLLRKLKRMNHQHLKRKIQRRKRSLKLLQKELQFHCMSELDENRIIIAGGMEG